MARRETVPDNSNVLCKQVIQQADNAALICHSRTEHEQLDPGSYFRSVPSNDRRVWGQDTPGEDSEAAGIGFGGAVRCKASPHRLNRPVAWPTAALIWKVTGRGRPLLAT